MKSTTQRSMGDRIPQFVRFVLVGVANTGFSYAVYALFLYLGLPYAIANLMALLLGILFSFKTQGTLVFNDPSNRRFMRFVIAWTLIYLFNIFLIGRLIAWKFDPYVSGALALPFAVFISYVVQRFFVFPAVGHDDDGPG